MKASIRKHSRAIHYVIGLCTLLFVNAAFSADKPAQGYEQTNLVADLPGVAANTDANLINAWGLVIGRDDLLVVNATETSLTGFYNDEGERVADSIQVDSEPTGLAWNTARHAFRITEGTESASSRLLFVTEEGKILGWNPVLNATEAIVAVDNSAAGAVYKGVALAPGRGGPRLYAANFRGGVVEVYDSRWHWVGNFTDPAIDSSFGPFNIAHIHGLLYVTFAKKAAPDFEDDEAGPGNGFVDVFTPKGRLLRRLISNGPLNSPWGIALAPSHFGPFSHALLVGNFGDGRINAFNRRTGAFLGPLGDAQGNPLVIPGLWGLQFGRPERGHGHGHESAELYFTAGPAGETHGLLGEILSLAPNKKH